MKSIFFLITWITVISCAKPDVSKRSVEWIDSKVKQQEIFSDLMKVTDSLVSIGEKNDSLAFLILPIAASCPSCRKKTIDSISKYGPNLKANHYIIISTSGGKKLIDGYFQEQNSELPIIENKLYLDTTNQSYRLDLCSDRPTIYYAFDRKVYKKVAAIPLTVRDDLREFFSGHRN